MVILYCIVLYCMAWHGMAWHGMVLYCIVLYCISDGVFKIHFHGGYDVAQWLESRNSNPKTLGSIPWRGGVTNSFFCLSESSLVQTCLCLTPLRVHGTHPNLRAR